MSDFSNGLDLAWVDSRRVTGIGDVPVSWIDDIRTGTYHSPPINLFKIKGLVELILLVICDNIVDYLKKRHQGLSP